MNKVIIGLIWVGMLFLNSCTEDKAIGEIGHLTSDYVLPQGKSPADDRVVELYKKFGSYFLYEFSRRDFDWRFINTSLGEYGDQEYSYFYTPADPKHVGDMLEFLDKIWFRFYPEELLKKTIPYRVLFVATLERKFYDYEDKETRYYRLEENQFVFSYCSDVLNEMPDDKKKEYRYNLQCDLLSQWLWKEIIRFPDVFYKVSDYSSHASEDPESDNYARKRGFIADKRGEEWSIYMSGGDYREYDLSADIYSYLEGMIIRTSEEWEEDLSFPLVKEKYDILQKHFKEEYGIDLKRMGDADYK